VSTTQLILSHRYRDNVAYDWSHHNNHGHLVGAHTGNGSAVSPNRLLLAGGGDRVEVRPSTSLRDFGELRVRVTFRAESHGGPMHRYNLVEGEFAFALVRESDGSLIGTINSPSAGWIGPQSAPGLVTLDQWHVADFVHDGVSHGRIFLDHQLVGERWDMDGPIGDLGARGVWIGHWPGDDRYTFVGQLDEVQIWKDDPEKDASRVIDDCCLDEAWMDQRVAEARRAGWTAETARDTLAALFGQARAVTAEVRDGDRVRSARIADLTQQALNAMAVHDEPGLEQALAGLRALVEAQLGVRTGRLGLELWELLRATPVGMWMGEGEQDALVFFTELADRVCLGDMVAPHRGKGDEPGHEKLPPASPAGDPDTDHDPPPGPTPAHDKVDVPPDAPQRIEAGAVAAPSRRPSTGERNDLA
jgi:hypothetical protein